MDELQKWAADFNTAIDNLPDQPMREIFVEDSFKNYRLSYGIASYFPSVVYFMAIRPAFCVMPKFMWHYSHLSDLALDVLGIQHFSENLPPILIDREQIKQVFLNLLVNAIEATDENGLITVKTRPYSKANGAPYIQIEFADTGCGIPTEYLESIFHPFFTTKHTGSGLGLSISNQIVQEHKGDIDVESQLNKGSTFYVNLPLHPEGIPRRRDF